MQNEASGRGMQSRLPLAAGTEKSGIIWYNTQYDTNKVVLNTDLQVTRRNDTMTVLNGMISDGSSKKKGSKE